MTRRLLSLLFCLAAATGVFAHSGEWGSVPPPVTYPPAPLPKWPGPETMTPKDQAKEAPRAPGRRSPRGATRSGWSRWWDLHRDRIFSGVVGKPPSAEERADALAALRTALKDPSEEIRTSAIIALGRARDTESVAAILTVLRDEKSSASVVRSSLVALGLVGDEGEPSRKAAREFLASDAWSTEIRTCAALAIGLAGDTDGRSALAARLTDRSSPPGLRAAAAAGLGILGDDRDAPTLAKVLTGGVETDPGVRAWAAAALANVKGGPGRTALMSALGDLDLGVARQAALSLGAHSDPWAKKALLETLGADGDPVTRAYAGLSLADAGDAAARDALLAAVKSGDDVLTPHAVLALALLAGRMQEGKATAEVRLLITKHLTDLAPVDYAGALVMAGMWSDATNLKERILKMAGGSGDPELRGHAAFAATMLYNSAKPVGPLIEAETPLPVLREVGRASALFGEPVTETRFRALLGKEGRESTRCVAAVTLGRSIREDRAATDALLAVLADEKQPELVRGCAVVGLGRRLEAARPSPLALSELRLSPELVGGPVREVISMR